MLCFFFPGPSSQNRRQHECVPYFIRHGQGQRANIHRNQATAVIYPMEFNTFRRVTRAHFSATYIYIRTAHTHIYSILLLLLFSSMSAPNKWRWWNAMSPWAYERPWCTQFTDATLTHFVEAKKWNTYFVLFSISHCSRQMTPLRHPHSTKQSNYRDEVDRRASTKNTKKKNNMVECPCQISNEIAPTKAHKHARPAKKIYNKLQKTKDRSRWKIEFSFFFVCLAHPEMA